MSIIDIRRHRKTAAPPTANTTGAQVEQGETYHNAPLDDTPQQPAPGHLYYSVRDSEPYDYNFQIGDQSDENAK